MNRKQRRAEQKQTRPAMPATASQVPALFALALQHHQAGRLDDAEPLYRRILAIDARHADSLHLLGVVALHTGRGALAVDLITRAVALNAGQAAYHANLGTALWKQGRLEEAAACYRTALQLKPDYPEAHFNLGTVLWKQHRLEEAMSSYGAAIALRPGYAEAHNNLGTTLLEQGRMDEAVACYRAAITLRPDYPEAHNSLGTALGQQGQSDAAIACYRTALDLRPDFAEAHFNLGTTLWEQRRLDAAIACYRRAIALRPDYPEAYDNLGTALREQGQPEAAIACYRTAIALSPNDAEAHSNLALALLAQGDMGEGWREHEWRWQAPHMIGVRRDFAQPQWHGEAAEGRTLLLHAEQGFGDTLQFCRYAELAAARGPRVVMEVQKPLLRLLRDLPGVALAVARGEALPPFDLQCPMLSMPLALGTTLASIPAKVPYLHADASQVAAWRTRLAAMGGQGRRVGLVWAGSSPATHLPVQATIDHRRSMAPDLLAPLFTVPGVRFFSLQKGGPPAPAAFGLTDVMDEMADFADTAALIANLDLVISVDTAVAHLAAGLGKPVWLLDRFDPCWRWLTGRRDSPWYPTLRLYRQPRPGDWDAVIAEVTHDLIG